MFASMTSGITKLTEECRRDMAGLGNWLPMCHDIWTTITTNGILGSSIKLTTSTMETYTIAAVLEKNNISHGADPVSNQLRKIYDDRYAIDLKTEAGNVSSDTTASAHNVAGFLDAVQNDCNLHVISLILLYSLGWNENTKTVTGTDESVSAHARNFRFQPTLPLTYFIPLSHISSQGKKIKVTHIVTPGGAFPDGLRIVREARNQVNYFGGSCQRAERLEKDRTALDLPAIALQNFPETRVAFIVMLIRSLLANDYLLVGYCGSDDAFLRLRAKLSGNDYKAMQEMEALLSVCFEYSTNESQQSSECNNSLLPWYRKVLLKTSYADEYEVMTLSRQPSTSSLKKWPRETRKVCVVLFVFSDERCSSTFHCIHIKGPRLHRCGKEMPGAAPASD